MELEDDIELPQEREGEEEIENPSHAQVDGREIYLGGLDYKLLEEQKKKDHAKGLIDMHSIQTKINLYSDRLSSKQPKANSKMEENHDPIITNLIKVISNKSKENRSAVVGTNVSYRFDIRPSFGALRPHIISRRISKTQQGPIYTEISGDAIVQFRDLMNRKEEQPASMVENKILVGDDADDSDE